MGLESGSFIPELVQSNPDGVDPKSEGDNHLRLIKTCVQGSFPAFVGTTAVPKFVAYSEEQLSDAGLLTDTDAATRSFLTPLSVHSVGDTTTENRILRFQLNDGTSVGRVGYVGQDVIELRNQIIGGNLELLAQNAADVGTLLFRANPDGNASLYNAGTLRFHTAAQGIAHIRSDTDTTAEGLYLALSNSVGLDRAYVGFQANNEDFYCRNLTQGGDVFLSAIDSGAVGRTFLSADPDGEVNINAATNFRVHVNGFTETALIARAASRLELYFAGILRAHTESVGAFTVLSDGNTDTEPRQLLFVHADNTLRGFVGYGGDNSLRLESRILDGPVVVAGRNSSNGLRVAIEVQPDTAVFVGNGSLNMTQDALTQNAFRVGGVESAFVRSLAAGALVVKNINSVEHKAGFRDAHHLSISASRSILQADEGEILQTIAAITLTVDALELGTQVDILTFSAAITLAQGSGVTIGWYDGAGLGPQSGNRTIARGSVIHLAWESTTSVSLWGNGIS